jgi:hypothetical protein
MRRVTADLNARTMVGMDPGTGAPNRSTCVSRGTASPCPYIVVANHVVIPDRRRGVIIVFHNPNDPMHVTGHHHEFIVLQLHIRTNLRGFEPFFADNLTPGVQ